LLYEFIQSAVFDGLDYAYRIIPAFFIKDVEIIIRECP